MQQEDEKTIFCYAVHFGTKVFPYIMKLAGRWHRVSGYAEMGR